MNKIVQLKDYIQRQDNREVWCCINCGYSDFWLYADGSVECAECKSISSEMHCFINHNH